MNTSTENSTFEKSSSNPQIAFREDLTQPEQELAERSVAALVAHAQEKFTKARARIEERAKLRAVLNAPFQRLIEQDPEALRAIDELRNQDLIHPDIITEFGPELPIMEAGDIVVPINLFTTLPSEVRLHRPTPAAAAVEVRVPPYDFSWSWFRLGNPPFAQQLSNASGRVALEARSGSVEGGASGLVEVHVGFGLVLRTNHTVTAIGRSFRRMHFGYSLDAFGLNSNATSEGGMEFTALENGNLINSVSAKLWHRRVSSSDDAAHDEQGPFAVSEPSELAFTMHPGREYTFNVGIWVFADRTPGFGVAAAISLLDGNILSITVQR